MFVLILFLCPSLILTEVTGHKSPSFLSDQYINKLNSIQNSWKAGRNFDPYTSEEDIKLLLGDLDPKSLDTVDLPSIKTEDPEWPTSDSDIPETFDARSHWKKQCPRISEVLDQGHCGSCWAVSSTSAATDRYCISSNGKHQIRLSAQHVAFCCHKCGDGCGGGYTLMAWDFFKRHGLISGGGYDSSEGCQPYTLQPCIHYQIDPDSHPYPNCSSVHENPPTCTTKCFNKQYKTSFRKDKRRNKNSYVIANDVKKIQKDIMTYGPVTFSFEVYSDFVNYKSGVYERTANTHLLGRHAVRVIGWGTENGKPYWLIMNSWNKYWGDEGLFKFKRGSNHCNIEDNALGGVPKAHK